MRAEDGVTYNHAEAEAAEPTLVRLLAYTDRLESAHIMRVAVRAGLMWRCRGCKKPNYPSHAACWECAEARPQTGAPAPREAAPPARRLVVGKPGDILGDGRIMHALTFYEGDKVVTVKDVPAEDLDEFLATYRQSAWETHHEDPVDCLIVVWPAVKRHGRDVHPLTFHVDGEVATRNEIEAGRLTPYLSRFRENGWRVVDAPPAPVAPDLSALRGPASSA